MSHQIIDGTPKEFSCQHVRTIDGDSFILRPHFARIAGGVVQAEIPVRAYGFSTPELNEPLGQDAKEQTDELLTYANTIDIVIKGYSFARTVCEVFVNSTPLDEHLKVLQIPVSHRLTKGFVAL